MPSSTTLKRRVDDPQDTCLSIAKHIALTCMDDVPNEHGPMRGRLELKHKQELSLAIDFQLSDDNTTHFEIPRETAVEPEPVRSTDVLTVPAKSKRAIRRANIANSGGEIGSNDKIKGTVRCTFGGQLEYLTTEVPETWVEAVYHNSIRGELIEENNRLGEYDYPRQKGVDATDVTCFNASQKIWGPNRTEWPEVLFRIYVNKDAGPKEKVKVWYHKNKVVLDSDRHAMRAFDDIPATISAQIEDYILVAMIHSDRRLKISDVRGRMPNVTRVANKNGDKQENLKSLNALSMMMTRFRLKAALMPRERRSGSKEIEQGLKAMLPDSCFKTSPASTKTLGRLLTDKEIKGLQEPNKGNFSFRSNRPEKRVSGVKKLDIPESSRKRKQSSPLHEADVPLEIMEDTSVAIGGKERVCKGKAREIVPNHVEGLTYSHSYGNDKAAGQLAPWGKVDRDIGSSGLIGDFPRFMASMGRPSLLTDECLRAQALEPVKNNSNQAFDDLLRPTPVPDFLSKSGLLRLDSSFPNPMEYSTKLFGKNGGPATYQIHNRTLEQAPSMASFQSSAGRVKIGEPGYQPSAAGKTNSSSELYYNFLTEQYEPFEEKNMGSYGLTGADSC